MSDNYSFGDSLNLLFETIDERKNKGEFETSYTSQLLSKGTEHIAQKVGEEAVELVIAATKKNRNEVISESADVVYHLAVLWASLDIDPSEIGSILSSRRGKSGLDEKSSRL